ncbi:MAG: hypothetical protein K6E35_05175 [Bacteroidales bacterium]|nr:hypothetical protein [Bacteroidales bacterium]
MRCRRSIGLLWTVLVCGLALSSCVLPDTLELFVHRRDAAGGVYVFSLPLKDTTAAYDFWFYTRSSGKRLDNLQLNVQWLAPSGDGFHETVYMRTVAPQGTKELYRSEMVPAQAGDWQLSVRPVGADEEILGLGVICKMHEDGTR